jgi:Tol biopolymer transport system component
MGESGTPTSPRPHDGRLDSWKEIAAYLGRDVTTVQRWEKRERMPVHRHLHDRMGSVYAFREELDAWVEARNVGPRKAPEADDGIVYGSGEVERRRGTSRFLASTRQIALPLALAALGGLIGLALWLRAREYFWRNPVAGARFQNITDIDGVQQAAAISRDGQFVAFLSDREGQMDVWLTQMGSGQFHNLTHGAAGELVNPSVRTLGFAPDGSLVTFWVRKQEPSGGADIGLWAVPTLGGQPRPYLEGAAELDWSSDGSRLVYHTPGPGDPLYVTSRLAQAGERIFTAPTGLHSHFPLWSSDSKFIYFVQGVLPDKLDIWRIRLGDGKPERLTWHSGRVSYPVLLDRRTLMYLASNADGSGPSLYSVDTERRIPHRLSTGLERYSSLAASADGRRLVVTVINPRRTLWRVPIVDAVASMPARISLTTSTAFSPRAGPNYLLYVSVTGTGESIWKLANGAATELWSGPGAHVVGAPAISSDGSSVAVSVQQGGQSFLYVMAADGSNARLVTDSLDLLSAPAWAPDSRSIAVAANNQGTPCLFRVPIDGGSSTRLVKEYSLDPVWAPDGSFIVYSDADVGTTFSVRAVTTEGVAHPLPALTLTRGARHLKFSRFGNALIVLRGEIQHKNLWLIDLQTGAERQLSKLPADFDVRDFDISPDGTEAILERVQDRSDVVLLDLSKP